MSYDVQSPQALVTGASSEMGRRVIERLLQNGYLVVAISRTMPIIEPSPPAAFYHWYCMDLSDNRFTYAIQNALGGRETGLVIHCAPAHLLMAVEDAIGCFGRVWMEGAEYMRQSDMIRSVHPGVTR